MSKLGKNAIKTFYSGNRWYSKWESTSITAEDALASCYLLMLLARNQH